MKTSKPFPRVLYPIVVLVIILVTVSILSIPQIGVSAQNRENPAILEALSQYYEGKTKYETGEDFIDADENFAVVRVSVFPSDSIFPRPTFVLAIKQDDVWTIYDELAAGYRDLVDDLPVSLLPAPIKQSIENTFLDQAPRFATFSVPPLSMPGQSGTLTFNGGPHAWTGNSGDVWNSLDFDRLETDGVLKVYPSAPGTAAIFPYTECNNTSGGYVAIYHDGGWQTEYVHLDYNTIPQNINGQYVNRSTFLGNPIACRNHVHLSVFSSGRTPVDIQYLRIGGWMVERGATHYEGCLTNVNTAYKFCRTAANPYPQFSNDGSIGGETTSATSWSFGSSMNGWVAVQGLEFLGFADGGVVFSVIGDDAAIFGPPSSFSASSNPYLHLKLATQADACGEIFWRRTGDSNFDENRKVTLSWSDTTGTTIEQTVKMQGLPNWNGTIVQIRVDPSCNKPSGSTKGIRIDRIKFDADSGEPTITPTPTKTLQPTITPTPTKTLQPGITPSPTEYVPTDDPTATLEPGDTELIRNGGFEEDEPGTEWTGNGKHVCNKPDKPPVANTGNCALLMKGKTGYVKSMTQKVLEPQFVMAGDELVLTSSVATKKLDPLQGRIRVTVIYTDKLKDKLTVYPPAGTNDYDDYADVLEIPADKTVEKIKIQIRITSTGKFYVDDLSLIHSVAERRNSPVLPLPVVP